MKDWSTLRRIVLALTVIETLIWPASFFPIIQLWGDPRSDGFEAIPLFFATVGLVPLALPALLLTLQGRAPRLAAILAFVAVLPCGLAAWSLLFP